MNNPFEVLGIPANASAEQVRHAYHLLARRYHPDQFQDPKQQQEAQERMIAINQAYHEALKQASHPVSTYSHEVTCEEAIDLARKMLLRQSPEAALRQLLRAATKSADWYYQQGLILMEMNQYSSAHQSFREAVRRAPDNNTYHAGALDAAVALKKSNSPLGKLKRLLKR